MKLIIALMLSFLSFSVLAQGLLFVEDKDKELEGPIIFKLGGDVSNQGLTELIGGQQSFFSRPIKARGDFTSQILGQLNTLPRQPRQVSIVCSGSTKVLNGVLLIDKFTVCVRSFDGLLLYYPLSMSADELKQEIGRIEQVHILGRDPKEVYGKKESITQTQKNQKESVAVGDYIPGLTPAPKTSQQ